MSARTGNQTYSVIIVLILVLMEDTHWEIVTSRTVTLNCLNPCFNGRYSLRFNTFLICELNKDCLNPCFNGRYSLSQRLAEVNKWPFTVLILVLMEDTHWESKTRISASIFDGLNPCFNGRYSLSHVLVPEGGQHDRVLILVLMEDTHWEYLRWRYQRHWRVLILVLMEDTHWDSANGVTRARLVVLILVLMEDTHWVAS